MPAANNLRFGIVDMDAVNAYVTVSAIIVTCAMI
jgi:hypothetical protein